MYRLVITFVALLWLNSCIQTESSDGRRPDPPSQSVEVADTTTNAKEMARILSITGDPFPPKAFEGNQLATRQRQLEAARKQYENATDSLESIVWYGRRLGYLGKYQEAIAIYSEGLRLFPDSYKLLRHRGEALITTRQFDLAMKDLESAAFFARNAPNEIEPDGLPNRLNKPLTNVKFNIWYHLGLAYYLKGNFDQAISAYQKCLEVSDNNDLLVATSTWLYRTYIKIGNTEEALAVLEPISSNMRLIENRPYLNILMLFKNQLTPERIYQLAIRRDDSLDPTVGYGLGNWYVLQGQVETAAETFDKVLASDSWDSFGYIASEVERFNLASAPL